MNFSISVVVTTYNQAPYIDATLNSVFAQTYKPFEVILVNDGSTDDTETRIASYQDRIRYAYQHNQGVAAARNTGIRMAKGELLAFLDGDDLWEREKLAVQVAAAQQYPDSGIIAVDGVQFGPAGILSNSLFAVAIRPFLASLAEAIISKNLYIRLLNGNFIGTTSQVIIPAKVFRDVGLSDPKFRICSDYDLYLRIAAKYPITLVKRPLTRWRYLETSASGPAELRQLNWSKDNAAILKKQLRVGPPHARSLVSDRLARTIFDAAEGAYTYGRRSDRVLAARYLLGLLLANPRSLSVIAFFLALWCPGRLNSMVGLVLRRRLGCVSADRQ